ncbi:bacterioferritin [Rubinisphaera margarita]|uniref:bacterioferritin n=1 Tax=Rubinisphaera margarita TaxID=2909586 RepID=UPI001EE7E92E|nr:bacterioferritin [Rubinisphaera margarita]MCG6155478.1 bacterioferritin [Rubinisphaera margarita]
MKGSPKVIEALNAGLTIELTAINQYFIQAKMCQNWALHILGAKHYQESIGEMKHAEWLIDRILFLEGVPEIARYDVIRVGDDVKTQFEYDLALETKGVNAYRDAIQLCHEENDPGTRDLLDRILVQSEEHVDWLESQLELIEKIGIQNYLMSQMGPHKEDDH